MKDNKFQDSKQGAQAGVSDLVTGDGAGAVDVDALEDELQVLAVEAVLHAGAAELREAELPAVVVVHRDDGLAHAAEPRNVFSGV